MHFIFRQLKIVLKTSVVFVFGFCAWLGAANGQNLVLGTKLELNTLDPHFFNAFPTGSSHAMLFERLTKLDPVGKVIPGLAKNWSSVNSTTWEFTLHSGVVFHDGSPFTADDVIATIDRVPNVPNTPNSFAQFTRGIDKITKVSDLVIRIATKQPNPTLPQDLANVFIVSAKVAKSATTADFNSGKAAIGTGPYKLVEWVNGDRLVVERFDGYWGNKLGDTPPWKRVTEKVIAKDSTRLAALLSGQIDAMDVVPISDVARLKKDPKFTVYRGPQGLVHYIALDSARDVSPFVTAKDGSALASNPLKDVRVRQALSMALPRDQIIDRLLEGSAIAAGGLTLPGMPGSSPKVKPPKHDPDKAAKLLKEAGWGKGFKITLHVTTDRYPGDTIVAQAIASAWTKVGIQVVVDGLPGAVFFTRATKQDFSAFAAQYGIDEVGAGLRGLIATPDKDRGYGTGNRVRYSNLAADQLLTDSLSTLDLNERSLKLERASEAYAADVGLIPVYHPVADFAARKGLVITPVTQRRFNGLMVRPAK
jgi:peptide/nickel transport system substrate-binding protein